MPAKTTPIQPLKLTAYQWNEALDVGILDYDGFRDGDITAETLLTRDDFLRRATQSTVSGKGSWWRKKVELSNALALVDEKERIITLITREHRHLLDVYMRSCEAAGMRPEDELYSLPELIVKTLAPKELTPFKNLETVVDTLRFYRDQWTKGDGEINPMDAFYNDRGKRADSALRELGFDN